MRQTLMQIDGAEALHPSSPALPRPKRHQQHTWAIYTGLAVDVSSRGSHLTRVMSWTGMQLEWLNRAYRVEPCRSASHLRCVR